MIWLVAAAVLTVTIDGPSAVEPGDLAVFRIQPPGVDVAWTVWPEGAKQRFIDLRAADGTTVLVFASRQPMEITIVVAACDTDGPVIATHRFVNGSAPDPQPDPPTPRPVPQPPFTLLWIEESSERTPAQAAAQNDREIRQAIERAGWSLRIVDVDTVDEHGKTPAGLAEWIKLARERGLPHLFAVDKTGCGYSRPAPRDRDEFIAILREWGLTIQTTTSRPPTTSRPTTSYTPRVYVLPSYPRCYGGVCIP